MKLTVFLRSDDTTPARYLPRVTIDWPGDTRPAPGEVITVEGHGERLVIEPIDYANIGPGIITRANLPTQTIAPTGIDSAERFGTP